MCDAAHSSPRRLQAVLTGAVAPGGGPIAPGSCSPVHVPCCGVQQYMAVCRGVLQPKLVGCPLYVVLKRVNTLTRCGMGLRDALRVPSASRA